MSESWQIIEALLFASPDVVSTGQLANAADLMPSEVEACINKLNSDYEEQGRAYHVRQVAGGWQMVTLPRFAPWIARLLSKRRRERLSKAALETLAVIAHRQPINKPDVDQTRGIDSTYILTTLTERGLVRIKGRDKRAGHPYVYVTTPKFLEFFGLSSLDELPDIEEPALKEEDILPIEDDEDQTSLDLDTDTEAREEESVSPDALAAIGYRLAEEDEEGENKDNDEEEK
ncbi:SMC-Scp complex subunit ScpB [candidate division WOR-3 bacterium]|nr:SMC-Scp complex subunit ScpB [candidate division WOR-3 bacterium]